MRKALITLMVAIVLASIGRFDAVAQTGRFSADSTEYIVTIDGREEAFPLVFQSENSRVYYRCGSFIEHDTLFFDREYEFYRCDTCRETELTVVNHFLTPRTDPNHDKAVCGNCSAWDLEKYKEYYEETYAGIFSLDSIGQLIPQDLGDVPRMWYPLLKREGSYYLSFDYPYPFELTDSLIVFQDMEIHMWPLFNFKKISDDEYSFEYTMDKGNRYHVSLRRSSKNRDLWLEVVTSPDDEHYINYEACTPLESIGSFDYINYRTGNHKPIGLCTYEETSPEEF